MRTIVAITGASGALFGVEFLRICAGEKYLILSRWGKSVLKQETGLLPEALASYARRLYADEDMLSPLASGSNAFDAMVIVPCSASTLSRIAAGIADSLITRAAAVALKERRKLILCLRETPLSSILIENMEKLSRAGAILMPVCPPFYPMEREEEGAAGAGARTALKAETVEETARLFAERIQSLLDGGEPPSGWRRDRL